MGVEKEYETDVGEEGVLSYEFFYTNCGASAESYTKKATDKEVSYEFLSKEEELTRSSWRTWRYYEFCQQVVELNKSLVKKCITSSTNKRWSSRTAWRSRRRLFSRLLR